MVKWKEILTQEEEQQEADSLLQKLAYGWNSGFLHSKVITVYAGMEGAKWDSEGHKAYKSCGSVCFQADRG